MAERDLNDEQFVDLALVLVHVLFDPEPSERQRFRRVHGRLRPRTENPVGEPLPETVDGDDR